MGSFISYMSRETTRPFGTSSYSSLCWYIRLLVNSRKFSEQDFIVFYVSSTLLSEAYGLHGRTSSPYPEVDWTRTSGPSFPDHVWGRVTLCTRKGRRRRTSRCQVTGVLLGPFTVKSLCTCSLRFTLYPPSKSLRDKVKDKIFVYWENSKNKSKFPPIGLWSGYLTSKIFHLRRRTTENGISGHPHLSPYWQRVLSNKGWPEWKS